MESAVWQTGFPLVGKCINLEGRHGPKHCRTNGQPPSLPFSPDVRSQLETRYRRLLLNARTHSVKISGITKVVPIEKIVSVRLYSLTEDSLLKTCAHICKQACNKHTKEKPIVRNVHPSRFVVRRSFVRRRGYSPPRGNELSHLWKPEFPIIHREYIPILEESDAVTPMITNFQPSPLQ